jgi:signal transduction histidine kinase
MRDLNGVRFDRALRTLADASASPRIRLQIAEGVTVADANHAVELLRCVQEIATNARRHGGAATLDVTVTQSGSALEISARDDGRGAGQVTEGNGLRGVRERVSALGGQLEYETSAGNGFVVRLRVPS